MAVASSDSMEVTTNRDVTNEQLATELAVTESELVAEPAEKTPAPSNTAQRSEPPAEVAPPNVDDSADPDPASEAGRKLAGKRKSMQQRIEELTWQRHQEVARREEVEKQLEALKAPKTEPAAAPTDGRPKLKDFVAKIGDTYDTYEDAVEAHTDALSDYKLAARDQASIAEQHTRGYQTALHQTHTRGTEKHADFDAKIEAMVQEGRRFTPFMTDAILSDPDTGHELAYVLATEPETYQALLMAPTLPAASRILGKILSRFEAAPSGSAPKPVPVSKAKPPIQPLGSSPVTADQDLDDIPFGPAYVRAANRKYGK